jgi:hypothetical protein
MATQSYKIKLAGKSQLHEPVVRLENISINLWSIDGGVTWENKNAQVNVDGNLEIFMSCKAISGTDWGFTVTNISMGARVVDEDSGSTGDTSPNYSERRTSVNP